MLTSIAAMVAAVFVPIDRIVTPTDPVGGIVTIIGASGAYIVVLACERRWPVELAPRRIGGLFVGFAGGAAVFVVSYAVVAAFGGYRLTAIGSWEAGPWLAQVMAVGLVAGFAEERSSSAAPVTGWSRNRWERGAPWRSPPSCSGCCTLPIHRGRSGVESP